MKKRSPFYNFALMSFTTLAITIATSSTSHASLRSEAIESVIKVISHSGDDAGKVVLRKTLTEAAAKHGDDVIKAAERGGLDLVHSAGKYGDEVWHLATLSKEAPKALAAHPKKLIDLSRRFGDDAVRLEIKAPACGERLATTLSPKNLQEVAQHASSKEIKRFATLATHSSPREVKAAVNIWKKSGSGKFLNHFTPAKIAASGLALSMIAVAWQSPDAALGVADTFLTGLLGPVITTASWLLVIGLLYILRRPLFWISKKTYLFVKKETTSKNGPPPPPSRTKRKTAKVVNAKVIR